MILNPTDFPTIGPLGQVTYAAPEAHAGMNVESDGERLGHGDPAPHVPRAGRQGRLEHLPHLGRRHRMGDTGDIKPLCAGSGKDGWFGWWDSPQVEAMVGQWLDAPDDASRLKLAQGINKAALEGVASVPLGQSFIRTMYRDTMTGMAEGGAPYPWGVKPA